VAERKGVECRANLGSTLFFDQNFPCTERWIGYIRIVGDSGGTLFAGVVKSIASFQQSSSGLPLRRSSNDPFPVYVPQANEEQDEAKDDDDREVQTERHGVLLADCAMENVGAISQREKIG